MIELRHWTGCWTDSENDARAVGPKVKEWRDGRGTTAHEPILSGQWGPMNQNMTSIVIEFIGGDSCNVAGMAQLLHRSI